MAAPLKYRVTWTVATVGKPGGGSGSSTVTMEVSGLQESVTLARDIYTQASAKGNHLSLTVDAPTGGTFIQWHLEGAPF